MTVRPETIPRPRLRLLDHERTAWDIDYGNGAKAQFWWSQSAEGTYPRRIVRWTMIIDRQSTESGWSSTPELAAAVVWCRVAAARFRPDPIALADDFELRRLADAAEKGTATEAAKIFRSLLLRRTGFRWSVRCSRHSSRISICAPPKRCRDGKVMRPRDVALLAAVLGDGDLVPNRGITIGEERGDRAAMVYKIAGHPLREARARTEVA